MSQGFIVLAGQSESLSVKSGELVGLIGPNGAGKSTTIKAIMGLLPIMDGKVEFTGMNRSYAYIPEQPVMYEGLTLWEHLELAAVAYEIERHVFVHRAEPSKSLPPNGRQAPSTEYLFEDLVQTVEINIMKFLISAISIFNLYISQKMVKVI